MGAVLSHGDVIYTAGALLAVFGKGLLCAG
jgi:hypothetical protein